MTSRLLMDLVFEDQGAIGVLTCSGSLDTYTFELLDEKLDSLFSQGCSRVLVDLSKVVRISSAGAGVLVASMKVAQQNGGSMAVVTCSKELLEVFDLLGLSSVLNIVPQRADGLTLLRS